jgi:serine/threonine protein phosphatase PrpC
MHSPSLSATALKAFGKSHPGLQRDNNEDRHFVDAGRGLFMVIDGVGGHAAGEKAADTALTMMLARLERETGTPAERLREAITLANNEINRLAGTRPEWQGMACVLTVALVRDGVATIGHVGDTRCYKFRDGGVRKITHDHSPVGEREDRGEITEIDAMRHPRRNEIYRDAGTEEHSPTDEEFIEIVEVPFESDSAMLLCTDGLTDLVTSARLKQIVYEHAGNRATVVLRLIEAANEAGGKDNVTAVYIEGEGFAASARGTISRRDDSAASVATRPAPRGWVRAVLRQGALLFVVGCLAGIGASLFGLARARSIPALPGGARPLLSWSRTWIVGPDPAANFPTIAEALNAARRGDTIQVEPGEYREAVRFPGGINLISRRPREAMIRPPADAVPGWTAIEADGVNGGRIAGFRIVADAPRSLWVGIRLRHATVEIDDVEIVGAEDAAIVLQGRGSAVVRGGYFHDNAGFGVLVSGGGTPRLLHNVIVGNGTRPGNLKAGLHFEEGARPALFGNIIASNGVDGISGLAAGSHEGVLRDNIVGPVVPAPPPKRDNAAKKK